jgi:predicted DCC family thiol-disulfide oxidoreductase YuxK
MNPPPRPLLVYDGDCGFCRYWVDYWRRLIGDGIDYAPYQEVLEQFPDIAPSSFERAIYLIEPGGRRRRAAEAAFAVLARAPGRGAGAWAYRWLPGFAWIAERVYALIARHREICYRLARIVWGPARQPSSHARVAALFLRAFGLIYFAAFASFAVQAEGLIGSDGILPLGQYLAALVRAYGLGIAWHLPTIFWLYANDATIVAACWTGAGAALLVSAGVLQRSLLALCFVLYLSLFYAGQVFLSFQWDLLLLEAGFLAIFLPRNAGALMVWLFRWLLFRFMFLSGWVKLASGDPSWRDLGALRYHFETQPLPSWIAWHAHQLPEAVLRGGVAATFLIELIVPFFIFLPGRLRLLAAVAFLCLQFCIVLTGNYNFFNLLTMLLCLFLIDDQWLARALPSVVGKPPQPARPHSLWRALTGAAATVVLLASATLLFEQLARRTAWAPLHAVLEVVAPFRIANGYGLFAVMTTERIEIVIQGAAADRRWRSYEFEYKPGDLRRRPPWNVPHQPRLDWQMWFAALGDERRSPWFGNLVVRLLQGAPPVLDLLADNPFPQAPPVYVRALRYRYRFTTVEERGATGAWWRRSLEGVYYPETRLKMSADESATISAQ